ncbi:hypothetical protein BFJ70_g5325 [Fusarium oxysporum]|nr:hypothetical protein BFJ70_g5325 [Fusarium oxysporum]
MVLAPAKILLLLAGKAIKLAITTRGAAPKEILDTKFNPILFRCASRSSITTFCPMQTIDKDNMSIRSIRIAGLRPRRHPRWLHKI